MKVIIDIPQDHKRVIDNLVSDGKEYLLPQEVETRLARSVKIGTVILDNATNGDIFLKAHPEVVATIIKKEGYLFDCVQLRHKGETFPFAELYLEWWNAPYRKVEE